MKNLRLLILTLTSLTYIGCGQVQKTEGMDDDSAALVFESAIGSLNGAANDSEQSSSYAFQKSTPMDLILPKAYAASCDLSRFSPAIGVLNCNGTENNKTVYSTFDNCTAGMFDQFSLFGQIKLSFDSSSTCASWIDGGSLPTSGSVVRTTDSLVRKNWNGSSVKLDSDSHQNYLGQTISGGVQTHFNSSGRSFEILGLHRTRTRANGSAGFDHSVYTTSPIVTVGTRLSGRREIQSGIIRVDHNKAKYYSTTILAGLVWGNSCCHPTEGSIQFYLFGSLNGNISLDFNTGECGLVNMTDNKGHVSQVELSTCE